MLIAFANRYESRQSFKHIGGIVVTYKIFFTATQTQVVTSLKSSFFKLHLREFPYYYYQGV